MSFYFGIGQPPRDSVASPTPALAALPTSKWRKRTARNRPPMRPAAAQRDSINGKGKKAHPRRRVS